MAAGIEDSVHRYVNDWAGSEQGQQKIRIVVADDQRLFRESVAGILSTETFIEVVGIAGDGLEAVELVRQLQPDIVLMDVKMPHLDGISATRQIKEEFPRIRVMLLTTFTTDDYVLDG